VTSLRRCLWYEMRTLVASSRGLGKLSQKAAIVSKTASSRKARRVTPSTRLLL
jgi:hypothetical protein